MPILRQSWPQVRDVLEQGQAKTFFHPVNGPAFEVHSAVAGRMINVHRTKLRGPFSVASMTPSQIWFKLLRSCHFRPNFKEEDVDDSFGSLECARLGNGLFFVFGPSILANEWSNSVRRGGRSKRAAVRRRGAHRQVEAVGRERPRPHGLDAQARQGAPTSSAYLTIKS